MSELLVVVAILVGLIVGGLVVVVRGSVQQRSSLMWAGVALIALGGAIAIAIGVAWAATAD